LRVLEYDGAALAFLIVGIAAVGLLVIIIWSQPFH